MGSLIGGADCSALPFMLSYADARGECFPYFLLLLLGIYPPCTPFALIGEVRTEQTVQVFQNFLYRFGVTEYGNRLFAVFHDFKTEG